MELETIKDIAYHSAEKYYDYCKQKDIAHAVINIKKIENMNSFYIFFLNKDMIYEKEKYDLRINNQLLNKKDYNFLKYDDESRQLFVSFNINLHFPITPENAQIESNLLFLIENVRDWYKNPSHSLLLPTKKPYVPSYPSSKKYKPSLEQADAVRNIKGNPLSYVWGAPGTGKTQFVLARCIVDYLKKFQKRNSKHKIIVCAPTNNSLEQILFGVFKVLEEEKLSTESVIRLGMPSKKFANKYPNSCECLPIQNEINTIFNKINELKSILRKRKENLEINELISVFDNFHSEFTGITQEVSELNIKKRNLEDSIEDIEYVLSKIRIKIQNYEKELIKINREKSKLSNRLFKKNQKNIQYKEDEIKVEIYELNKELSNKNHKNITLNNDLKDIKRQLKTVKKTEALRNDLFSRLKKQKNSNSEAINLLLNYLRENINESFDTFLSLAKSKCNEIIEQNNIILSVSNYNNLDDSQINIEIEKLSKKYDELIVKGTKAQIEKSSVIALTADRFILEYKMLCDINNKSSYKIEHIFVDEAAYLSMIKGLIIFSFGKPTTLLGDHMQLPPVFDCERTYINDNPSLTLWEIPIIYFEELFENSFDKFLDNYKIDTSPTFNIISKIDLNTTYRFGHNLADILKGVVYSDEFRSSNEKSPTKITIINAAKIPTNLQRVSPLEIRAIKDYISFFSAHLKSFAVLTPYKKQLSELQKVLPIDINCMTIHASQGQEWDTVIVSVVDTFMPSNNKIINTAVSRAKKHLIVVCDKSVWDMHPTFLISKIISHSDKIINYNDTNSYK